MTEIIPAITPKSFEDLREKISHIVGHVPVIHIDVANATLSSNSLWPYMGEDEGELEIPYADEANFEVHFMVANPEEVVGDWATLGVERVIFHLEAFYTDTKLSHFIKEVRSRQDMGNSFASIEVGLCINLDTPLEKLIPHIEDVDFVQFMSIASIGSQKNPFDPRVLNRIREFKAEAPHTTLAVDGGIRLEHVQELVSLGVDRLVVGSAIVQSEDPEESLMNFLDQVNRA